SIFEGKEIRQPDMEKHKGMIEESIKYYESDKYPENTVVAWTGAMFSGMPTYSTAVPGTPQNYMKYIEKPIKSIDFLGASMVLTGLICFYILMCVMGINYWLAIAGSIAFALASYNIIIIDAGHITKAYVIAYMPLTIAGLVLVFKDKLLAGALLFTLGVCLSIMNSHIQITYYLAISCFIFYIYYLVEEIKKKNYLKLAKITGILAVCVVIAILPNVGSLYSNYEMSKTSIRGPSELTETKIEQKGSSGLDIDYAFMWSYGKAETFTILIPNVYGGSSGGTLGKNSALSKAIQARGGQAPDKLQSYTYWGDQPGTSGPVYFGAIVCFLFLLGMFVIKNPVKWWILGITILFIFLSWGRNFAAFNDFLFYHFPLYNKFRVPAMALVIPGITFPIIALWGLKEVLTQKIDTNYLKKALYYSVGITGGICLILWLIPGAFFDFVSSNDVYYQLPDWYYNALIEDRESLLKSDSLRSLIYILLGAGLINWFIKSKNKAKIATYAGIGITALILVDLWSVDKRYLNNDSFITPRIAQNAYTPTVVDIEILKDKNISYRVLNFNDPFNETHTSYYHKSIGGYSAAKLRRYQELIENRISLEMNTVATSNPTNIEEFEAVFGQTPTLNMLNTRYIIYNPAQPPLYNPFAFGTAWFVRDYEIVENADAEMASLNRINPRETAVLDKRFSQNIAGLTIIPDSTAQIEMTSYEPIHLVYKSSTQTEQLAVFSEIYYPNGWYAYIDGVETDHFQVDWTLRAMKIPAGEHTIEFKFIPHDYITATKVSSVSSIIILLFLLFVVGWSIWLYYRKSETN
ncbi:MAG: hypothetical protein LIO65_01380, partial [Odoribacter sp.]|nr:hypothetical protein [Odoribacter sp.]